ncbi:MAG: nickel-dependent lactate racemase [Bacteroidota bacterium]
MKITGLKLGGKTLQLHLPDQTDIFAMTAPKVLTNPAAAIREALDNSINSSGLDHLIRNKLAEKPDFRTVIVVSDNTRPTPYRGAASILWPVVERLLQQGISKDRILVLVATGTHRAMTDAELQIMLDPKIFEIGIEVQNHDCRDETNLVYLGETKRGSRVLINRHYIEADLKILTGLVESHFMAGASGGRKSVCPGLIGEESTYVFHGAPMLASPLACDLSLEGNPCHDEALEVAKRAGVDYIINVTLDHHFQITGVFAGELEAAHSKAVERVKEYVTIPVQREYDIVITHAGFVGINHYQAAKAAVAAIPVLKKGGWLIEIADNSDANPVGSPNYQTVLQLLKLIGSDNFSRLIKSPDWTFIPEQWQVQMWAKVFMKIPMEHFIYYSPQLTERDFGTVPGMDGNVFLPPEQRYRGTLDSIATVVEGAIEAIIRKSGNSKPSIAFLTDGPYGIPAR